VAGDPRGEDRPGADDRGEDVMLWRMAWRNLWRNRARTLTMMSAVALSYALMLIAFGINDDGHGRMLREAAIAAGGDVLIHGKEYWATRASDIVVRDADAVTATVAGVEGVRVAAPRVILNGLASTSADNRPVLLQGVRPELEAELRDIAEDLTAGTFLTGDERSPLVLGSRVAARLEAELGDRIVLTGTTPDGEVTRALFHLTGILETGMREVDEVAAYTTLEAAQRAFGMAGAVTQIGIVAESGVEAEELAARVRAALTTAGVGGDLEVLSWREAVPEMVALIEIDDALGYIFIGLVYAIVLFSITNTFLMAVKERVRELGLLGALGMSGRRIGRLLLRETVLLTALAMAVGLAIGYTGHRIVASVGIDIASMGVEEMEMSGVDFSKLVMYSTIVPARWIIGSIVIAVATVASAVYPAWRAARLEPAEAMRFYE
jgi:ABC-type lipoprotein release transport system permease subunit